MFNYAGWRNACNYIFIGFAAVFIVTRLIIFPFRLNTLTHKHESNHFIDWSETLCPNPHFCVSQDYLLYVGLPGDHLRALFRLLLFQWTFDGAAVSTYLLGCAHHTHSSPLPHQQCKQINTSSARFKALFT